MDESLAHVAVDLSGRPALVFAAEFTRESVGGLATEMVRHFFNSLAQALGAAVHVSVTGENTHHMVEACFKGLGRALRPALARTEDGAVPSTKGVL
jgi:imidazoleglycerol-phosphate dehydratase/histidinol-phosphatase